MTKKELIEDGWIDKYVLGLTTEDESVEVERLASLYPELQEQINQARTKLLGTFNRSLTRPALRHSMLTKRRILMGSALLISIVLAGFAFLCREHFYLKEDYHTQYEKLAAEQAKVKRFANDSRKANERASFVNSATTKRIKLKGCESSPDAEVLVFHCKLSGKMMMQVVDLPELPSGQHYEVWAQHPELVDRKVGQLHPPVRYDSLYILDTALYYTSLQISSVDPVTRLSEPVCLATIKK